MKPLILAAAVAAFELAFFASVATPPEAGAPVEPRDAGAQTMAQGVPAPVPCTPRG